MGKAKKASRKGKKEWRKNIDTTDHDEFLERDSRNQRSGGPLDSVPDSAIFFVDKVKDVTIQRKIDRHRNKVLHCDKVMQRSSMVAPVPWPMRSKDVPGGQAGLPPAVKAAKVAVAGQLHPQPIEVVGQKRDAELDLWAPGDLEDEAGGANEALMEARPRKKTKVKKDAIPRTQKSHRPAPAVEVDGPGCSFNPSFEDHQDALGLAVAQAMRPGYEKELEPQAPPLRLPGEQQEQQQLDEEAAYFLEAGLEDGGEEEEEEEEEQRGEGSPFIPRPVKVKKLTQADLNRKLRRRAAEAEATAKAERKKQREDVGRLKDIEMELEGEADEKGQRRLRRDVARMEKQAAQPPRMGPHRFQADAVQVLLTEEVTGSLRKLKGCHTLARERFKSLQRRGLVEPRVPVRRRQAKNRRIVEQGSKGRLEREMHEEIAVMRAARKKGAPVAVHE